MQLIDILGYIGALMTLTAFFQVSNGRWHGQSLRYQITNLVAGVVLTYYGFAKHAYANILLNGVWSLVALYGLYAAWSLLRRTTQARTKKKA